MGSLRGSAGVRGIFQGFPGVVTLCFPVLLFLGLFETKTKENPSKTPRFSLLGAKKSTQTFFVQSFSKTLRVMDVRAKNRGRPHQKVRFSAAPVMGRNFLTQGRPGARVRNVRGKSGPKSLCLCCFSSLIWPCEPLKSL